MHRGREWGAMWFQGTKPIAIISRSLSKAERNYTTTERELLAIVYALKKWRHYVESTRREISFYTDHMNLIQNLNADGSNRRINKWVELIQWALITYKYVEGKKNPADLPSRRPDFIREEGETSSEDEDWQRRPYWAAKGSQNRDGHPSSTPAREETQPVWKLPPRVVPHYDY